MVKTCKSEKCKGQAPKRGNYCYKCLYEKQKAKDPVKWAYGILRRNARRRGKSFEITLQEFAQFCYETEILHGRGRTSTSYHIDRIDDELGYTKDNLQVLTNSQNIRKENARRRKVVSYDYLTGQAAVRETQYSIFPNDPNCPF